jgi:hypothetical protein
LECFRSPESIDEKRWPVLNVEDHAASPGKPLKKAAIKVHLKDALEAHLLARCAKRASGNHNALRRQRNPSASPTEIASEKNHHPHRPERTGSDLAAQKRKSVTEGNHGSSAQTTEQQKKQWDGQRPLMRADLYHDLFVSS